MHCGCRNLICKIRVNFGYACFNIFFLGGGGVMNLLLHFIKSTKYIIMSYFIPTTMLQFPIDLHRFFLILTLYFVEIFSLLRNAYDFREKHGILRNVIIIVHTDTSTKRYLQNDWLHCLKVAN